MAKCHHLAQVGHVLCTNLDAKLIQSMVLIMGSPSFNTLVNWIFGNTKHGAARVFKQVGHRQGHGQ
eukprot:6546786-Prorocentrum_lima.AAC.1